MVNYLVQLILLKIGLLGIKYGLFIQSIIDFIIIAFALFIFVKIANTVMKKKKEEEVEENTVLLTEIRDLLKNNQITISNYRDLKIIRVLIKVLKINSFKLEHVTKS